MLTSRDVPNVSTAKQLFDTPGRTRMVMLARGSGEVRFQNSQFDIDFTLVEGSWQNLPTEVSFLEITGTIPLLNETIKLVFSDVHLVGGSRAPQGPVTEGGGQAGANLFPRPLPAAGVEIDPSSGDYIPHFFRMPDGESLQTISIPDQVGGALALTDHVNETYISSYNYGTLIFSVESNTQVSRVQVLDVFDVPMAVYPSDGSAVIADGILPAATPNNYRFVAPGVGAVRVKFKLLDPVGVGTAWSLRWTFSVKVWTPRLG